MRDRLYAFCQMCEKADVLYCYGAGWLGEQVGRYLQARHIHFDGYVVSNPEPGKKNLLGRPVYGINQIADIGNPVFILGVTAKYCDEIKDALSEHGFGNFLTMSDDEIQAMQLYLHECSIKERIVGNSDYFVRYHKAASFIECDMAGNAMNFDMGMRYLIDLFLRKRKEGRTAYFIGNGGSAGIAMHMTNDFLKNGQMRTHSMHDAATLTCLSNDFSYEEVFSHQIEMIAQEGDLLIAISSSGNSPNIVKAIEVARKMKCEVLTLSGFGEDNLIRKHGDYNVYVPSREYGIVESLHNTILQRVVDGMLPINNKERNPKRIDFIVESATGRVQKIAEALSARGYFVRAYYLPWTGNVSQALEGIRKACYENVECHDEAELFKRLMLTDAFVVHHFMLQGDVFLSVRILSLIKDSIPRYVVEHYDVFNGLYTEVNDQIKANERFAFEHADGVIFREFSGDYLEKNLDFNFKGKRIVFLDYNSNSYAKKNIDLPVDKELSLVYSGGVATERQYPNASFACMLDFAELCEHHKCHFHLYAREVDEEKYVDYIELDRRSEFFHFHRPVSFSELYKEISQYDYAVVPVRDNVFESEVDGYYTRQKILYAGTNKFFDFVAAGLPIIAVAPKLLVDCFSEQGVVVKSTIGKIDFEGLKARRDEMRCKVLEKQQCFSMDAHIDELIEFYQSL